MIRASYLCLAAAFAIGGIAIGCGSEEDSGSGNPANGARGGAAGNGASACSSITSANTN